MKNKKQKKLKLKKINNSVQTCGQCSVYKLITQSQCFVNKGSAPFNEPTLQRPLEK